MKPHKTIPFDLHELQAFVAVCDAGSMTDAARILGVTQSAVSQMIKSMEEKTGTVFLDRDFRPSRPTGPGRLLLEMANELLDHARLLAERMASASRTEDIQIRLACVDSFAATVGPALVKAISGSSRQVTMWSGLTPLLSEQLQGREVDLAIVTETQLKNTRVRQRALLSEAFVVAVPKKSGKKGNDFRGDFRVAADTLPLIRYTSRSVIGQQVDRYIRHIGIESSRRFEFDATDPMLSMVASGLGWAITTPLCLMQARHYLSEIDVLPLPDSEIGRRKFFLLSREGEWTAMANEIAKLTQMVLTKQIIPGIRKALPSLPAGAVRCL